MSGIHLTCVCIGIDQGCLYMLIPGWYSPYLCGQVSVQCYHLAGIPLVGSLMSDTAGRPWQVNQSSLRRSGYAVCWVMIAHGVLGVRVQAAVKIW